MTVFTIAVDAMGGDFGPSVTVPAALQALTEQKHLHLILVGDQAVLQQYLQTHQIAESKRLIVHHASEVVAMDELPSVALRGKKDSSMRVAIDLVKQNKAHACVSAGNTGALMATARFVLKTLPGIDRPAIITALPTIKANCRVRVLDLGANVDSEAKHIFQFAVMGSVLTAATENIQRPTVGLLNIGAEEIKGNEQVKKAAQLLSESPQINYIGYVEGDDIYKGVADVVVCDGFVGNVALKVTEGVAKMIIHYLKAAFNHNWLTRLAGFIALPVLNKLRQQVDPSRYNGASLVGLQGIVVKSHGSADKQAFTNAIIEAMLEAKKNVPQRIHTQVGHILEESSV